MKKGLYKSIEDGPGLIVYFSGDHLGENFTAKVVSPTNSKYEHGYWKTDWKKVKFKKL
ncbi:MAG: hypothetical protein WD512_04320 [Candidatus Paceibacterota bacterium]